MNGILAPPEPSPIEPGCIWPSNKLTDQDSALFTGTIGERYPVGQLITRSCPSHCGTPTASNNGCFNYIVDKTFICTMSEKRGETFYFWNRIKGQSFTENITSMRKKILIYTFRHGRSQGCVFRGISLGTA